MYGIKRINWIKRLLYIIPILIVLFLIYQNFIVSQEFIYLYDIGNNENYLSPSNRLSEPVVGEINYRNLTGQLVYFNVPLPLGAEIVKLEVKFKDNSLDSSLMIGAKDQKEWHYKWKTLNNPFLGLLKQFPKTNTLYKINSSLPDISLSELESSKNLVIGSISPLNNSANTLNNFIPKKSSITTSLRGAHTFYFYAKGNFDLSISKQDLNWYEGADALEAFIYDGKDTILANLTIPDDGEINASKKQTSAKKASLNLNLEEGVYKLMINDFDGLIREIELTTEKIVAAGKLYLADSDVFIKELNKSSTIYTKFDHPASISMQTWHNAGLQEVYINNQTHQVKERINETLFEALPGEYNLTSYKNDLIVSAPGYFSFSKQGYFEPFKNKVVPMKNNLAWIERNLDYAFLEDNKITQEGDWLISEIEFDIKEENLFIENNKLSFVFNKPGLGSEGNNALSIDWIRIKILKGAII